MKEWVLPALYGYNDIGMSSGNQYWKRLWNIKAPSKMLHLLWRMSKGFVPTRYILFRHLLLQSGVCFRCGEEDETPLHAIWSCGASKNVWQQVCFYNLINHSSFGSFQDWMDFAWSKLGMGDMILLVVICWFLWYERNQTFHGSAPTPPHILLQRAIFCWEDIKASNASHDIASVTNRSAQGIWQPPPMEYYKLNADGNAKRGVGGVVRNHEGVLMGAVAKQEACDISVLATELFAIKTGLEFALDCSFFPLIVESDCLEVVSLVNMEEDCSAADGVIVSEIKSLLRQLNVSEVFYRSRECSKVAHSIAKFIVRNSGCHLLVRGRAFLAHGLY
ncbi:uncharacterized protein LOC133725379 [Rosa rugosa]|uniref:uncharacterized protein LOC133725379 n=1 Tax=Rosa rugosa TaxID=74645 RepID=UPI002B40E0C7|nr:uncharacterized protein LOC133725379 [Rosa rugosa]